MLTTGEMLKNGLCKMIRLRKATEPPVMIERGVKRAGQTLKPTLAQLTSLRVSWPFETVCLL